jgi:hypothetical protein
MKKPIILSSVVAISLYGNVDFQHVKSDFSNFGGETAGDGYKLFGVVGGNFVGAFENSKFKSTNGFLNNPQELNSYPEINISKSVSVSEDGATTFDFSYFDAENDELNITIPKNGSIGTLSRSGKTFKYIPRGNQNGSDKISLKFDDGFGGIVEKNVSISVLSVDDAPVLATISDLTIDEDSETKTVNLSISDIDSSTANAIISFTSSNSEIAEISVVGQTLSIVPKADKFGTSKIDVKISLDGKEVLKSFNLVINPVDDEPILGDISDLTIDEDSETKTVNLSISDIDSSTANSIISFTSSNSEIAEISVVGQTLSIFPKADKFGTSKIDVKISLDGKEVLKSFNLVINPIDDEPVLGGFEAISNSGTGVVKVPISVSDIDSDLAGATYKISSSNPDLADISVVDGEIVITPKGNISGETEITLTANIDGIDVSQTFKYSTERINSAPTIGKILDQSFESSPENFSETILLSLEDDIEVAELFATSSNPEIISVESDLINSQILLKIGSGKVGNAIISVVAKDGDGLNSKAEFSVEVLPNSSQICVSTSKTALTFETIRGENSDQNYIRHNLNLPTSLESCNDVVDLSWKSSNENIINSYGDVTVDIEKDYTIQLIATIFSNGFESEKSFLLTVPKEELTDKIAVDQAFEILTFDSIRGENSKRTEIYSDLNLYTSGVSGTSINWASSNSAISTFGAISRDLNDTKVDLNATISKGDEVRNKLFSLVVKGEKVGDYEIVQSDKIWLTLAQILNKNRDKNSIVSDLNLHKIGINGSEISWKSSNENIISVDGNVSRDPILDRYIELSATLKKGEFSENVDFLLKVLQGVEEVENSDQNLSFNRIENIEGNSSKIISMFLNSGISEIFSTVEIDNNISNVETIISEESVKTVIENSKNLMTIYLNSDGTSDAKVELFDENNKSIESSISFGISGGKSVVNSDGSISSKSDKSEVLLNSDGSTSHKISSSSGKISTAISKLAGSSVKVLESGIETSYETVSNSENGDKLVVKAVVKTDENSKSETSFTLSNLTTGEIVELEQTLSDGSNFSEGSQFEISEGENSQIEIKINTSLEDDLEVK